MKSYKSKSLSVTLWPIQQLVRCKDTEKYINKFEVAGSELSQQIQLCEQLLHSVHPPSPFCLGGGEGQGADPPTKFSKRREGGGLT